MLNGFARRRGVTYENARLVDPVAGERRGSVCVVGGRIVGINMAPRRDDIHFDLGGATVLPAFINAHDHLELNNFPRLKFRPCYANAREWAEEGNARLDHDPQIVAARRVPLADRLFIGGLKNLLAGVGTVAHHNPYHAPLRNNFPVRVVARYSWSHSLYLAPDVAGDYRRTPRDAPYMIHLAEGTDDAARQELDQLDALGALQNNTVLIHGVGLYAADRARVLARGAALVWCPSSNYFLLEETAQVREFSKAHQLAIGSDSRLTAEGDLLDELRVARATHQISTEGLLRAVTSDAANILRLNDCGRIERGMRADLVILPEATGDTGERLGMIQREELRAVIVGGEVRVADEDFAPLVKQARRVRLDGRAKLLAGDLAERAARNRIAEAGLEL